MFVNCGPKHILVHGGFDANNKELGMKFVLLFEQIPLLDDVNELTWYGSSVTSLCYAHECFVL